MAASSGAPAATSTEFDMSKPYLSFHAALNDTPQFRTDLSKSGQEIKEMEKKYLSLAKSSRKTVDQSNALSESNLALATSIQSLGELESDDQLACRAYSRIAMAMEDIEQHRAMACEHTAQTLEQPMVDFVANDLADLKGFSKTYEQLSRNVDNAREKLCTASRKKDDALNARTTLEASVNVFTFMSLDLVYQVNKVMGQRRFEVLERVVSYVFSQLSFYRQCFETLRELEPHLRMVMEECQRRAEQLKVLDQDMEKRHELVAVHRAENAAEKETHAKEKRTEVQVGSTKASNATLAPMSSAGEAEALSDIRSSGQLSGQSAIGPVTNTPCKTASANLVPGMTQNSATSGLAGPATGWTPSDGLKRGYLYAKGVKKGSKSWHRYYVFIEDGTLFFQLREANSQPFAVASLHLCSVKPIPDDERKTSCCLITPCSNITLQALDEQSIDAWVAVLQSEICAALGAQQSPQHPRLLTDGYGSPPQLNCDLLAELQAVEGNSCCCDCGHPDPAWASINMGTMLCIECSGVHRRMGVHVSKVRSATLDKWDTETVKLMKALGNKAANQIYEAEVSPNQSLARPGPDSDRSQREQWIRSKYLDKAFIGPRRDKIQQSKSLFKACADPASVQLAAQALAFGADVEYRAEGEKGAAPLHVCVAHGNQVCAELLVQNTANVNSKDDMGYTPLHIAARAGDSDFALFLLRRGANHTAENNEGKAPVDLAVANLHAECVTQLRLHALAVEENSANHTRERRLNTFAAGQTNDESRNSMSQLDQMACSKTK